MKKVSFYILYLLVVWGGFRYFFNFSSAVDELMFKPVIWLVPLFWWNSSLGERVEFFGGRVGSSILLGLLAGAFYTVVIRGSAGIGLINWDLFGVSVVTAVVEELAFSGFVLGYLVDRGGSVNMGVVITSILVAIVRLPILIFDFRSSGMETFFACAFVFATSLISGLIRTRSGNVGGSIVARIVLNISLLS